LPLIHRRLSTGSSQYGRDALDQAWPALPELPQGFLGLPLPAVPIGPEFISAGLRLGKLRPQLRDRAFGRSGPLRHLDKLGLDSRQPRQQLGLVAGLTAVVLVVARALMTALMTVVVYAGRSAVTTAVITSSEIFVGHVD
jgi:hypothetical protein